MATPENHKKIMWLSRYRSICRQLHSKYEELEKTRALETKVTQTLSDMPHGGGGENSIEAGTEKVFEIESQIADEIRQLTFTRSEIENAIRAVPDENYRELLELRYIDGLTWEKIAVKMNYTYKWVCTLHGKALGSVKISKEYIEIHTPSVI